MTIRTFNDGKMILILLIVCLLVSVAPPVTAEPTPSEDERMADLLEKSLSLVEIDKEIERIGRQKTAIESDLEQIGKRLQQQENQIEQKREEAGKVLRAYYMGERDMLLRALLQFRSLADFLAILDYIDIIFSHDKAILNDYKAGYALIRKQQDELEAKRSALEETEGKLRTQRERVLALEKQIDGELAGRSDAERLRLMMKELTDYWETAGLREVELYFSALSKAMGALPKWVQDNKEMLEIDGFNYTLHIPEDSLNQFLREQDPRFESFAFVFKDGKVTAQGTRDGMELSISGHYTVEDKPQNGLIFHVDDLRFNGFALPDTTRRDLENRFDLGFYPGLIISFLKAKEVTIEDGELTVLLKISL
ncbi:coiled-coil domain-containing protein [Paenibacillus sp. NPDC058071]|uniref:coiled-coil domain-containing protein n=1 Tax=Paenibacillus sp. NPDC058071 TaxID=3346326 RepID=UPI0036DA7049